MELQSCTDGEDERKNFLLESEVVCGMPERKASGPHWKGCGAKGPGVGKVARSNQFLSVDSSRFFIFLNLQQFLTALAGHILRRE